jgi:hypothetical protein
VRSDLSSTLDCEVLDDGRTSRLRSWAERRGVDPGLAGPPDLLLAYGSNASVAGLSRKLADSLDAAVVPVDKAALADLEAV